MVSETHIKGRYCETDQMGIIHHSVYATWYEVARNDFIENVGISYNQIEKDGIMMPIVSLECCYIFPAHFDENIIIETKIQSITASRIIFSYTAKSGDNGKILNRAKTTQCFVDKDTFIPLSLKKRNPELFEKFLTLAENNEEK